MNDIKKFIDKGNKEFMRGFLIEAIQSGEISKLQGDRIMNNNKLKHFFHDDYDEIIEKQTLDETARELHNLKQKIRGDGLEYLLCESDCNSDEYLMECGKCSRVWDGNAQCPCGLDEAQ